MKERNKEGSSKLKSFTSALREIEQRAQRRVNDINEKALGQREDHILRFMAKQEADKENLRREEEAVEALRISVEKMFDEQDKTEQTLELLEYKVLQAGQMVQVKDEENKLERSKQDKADLESQIQALDDRGSLLEDFSTHIGIQQRGLVDSNLIVFSFDKIDPLNPTKEYLVFFEYLRTKKNGASFRVSHMEPPFPNCEEVAAQYNESQKFKEFLLVVQSKFKEYQNSIRVKKEKSRKKHDRKPVKSEI